jgi:hypothetical protein
MYLTKSRPDISAAVSFGATKAIVPNARDQHNLLYIAEYLRKTAKQGHRIYAFIIQGSTLNPGNYTARSTHHICCIPIPKVTRDIRWDYFGRGHFITGALNRLWFRLLALTQKCALSTLLSKTSSLSSSLISTELQLDLQMPAIIMEDNSAVVTVTTDDANIF